eukprot:SAG11_NODE_21485_length_424_cov_0.867692_2_plen_28_part_01
MPTAIHQLEDECRAPKVYCMYKFSEEGL